MVIPLAKQGKESAVRNLLLRHLTSQEIEDTNDGGLQIFKDVVIQVEAKLAAKSGKTGKPEIKAEVIPGQGDVASRQTGGTSSSS